MLPTEGAGEEGDFASIRLTQKRRDSVNLFDDGEEKKEKKNRKSMKIIGEDLGSL